METKDAATTAETAIAAVANQSAAAAPATKKATKKTTKPAAKKEAKPASKKTSKAATSKKKAKRASKKAAKPAAAKKDAKPSVPREFSKKAIVLDLLRRKDGATMDEIAKATDWQKHSIRGFISGQVAKRMGLTVESAKNETGERTYRITN